MEKQKPIDFSISTISDLVEVFRMENIFLTNEFGIFYKMADTIRTLLLNEQFKLPNGTFFKLNQPYRIKESRIVLLVEGQVTIQYNLMEYVVHPSQIFTIPTDSIVQICNVTPNTILCMIGFGPNFIPFARKDEHFDYYLGTKHDLVIPLSESQLEMAENYFRLIWETVQLKELHREIVQHMLIAFLHFVSYIRKGHQLAADHRFTHQDRIFNRFISLVDKYSLDERSVGFYADKLCLTPRYLNTIIRQTSGQTVMEWINQAVVLEAKVLLKHNDLLIYQVSDKLNFSNPSFFCTFFKRMTGMTPQEYQKN